MKLPKHHYIPVFYLKAWLNADKQVVEYSRPNPTAPIVKPRRVHPDGTGYERGLYRLPGVKPELADAIETVFMKSIDNIAADAHKLLLCNKIDGWAPKMRDGWSRFILGLIVRSPASLKNVHARIFDGLEDQWEEVRGQHQQTKAPDEPSYGPLDYTLVERRTKIMLQRLIDNPRTIKFINDMAWSLVDISKSNHRFVTSDRPVVMVPGNETQQGFLVMPISKTKIFIASNNPLTKPFLESIDGRFFATEINKAVVRNAVKYAWAENEAQGALMHAHLSADAHKDLNLFKLNGPFRLKKRPRSKA